MAEFIRSYTPAIRSNMPCTSEENSSDSRLGRALLGSVSGPACTVTRLRRPGSPRHRRPTSDTPEGGTGGCPLLAAQRGEEQRQVVELLGRQAGEVRHPLRRGSQRAGDRFAWQAGGAPGSAGGPAVVAVLSDLVAGHG